ncbi:TonB-dependent receptor [Aestuariicella hydrocarbonica]|uniref:TonB-dependent receptor n=1 Tax=Pseudomaricurvus hydrocarbonicus TaxID=1470433 RepID=A0A9E5T3Q4_9GAMM|nr:TonB-dependent receptor [Aestuariicella hydrocarbonica]NHO67368.1 TonB-dependent receptor [Aestuariicella hydrocarbonica]
MYKKSLLALAISISSAPFLIANPVMAKDTGFMLEEVVVTAQRKEQSSQDVPISLTSVSGDSLADKNLTQVTELTLVTPGLQLGRDDSLAVRGVGSVVFVNTLDSSVALSVDEVNYGRPGLGGALFNDIERIEVLYGPQGLLFGKNASAGLINITSKKPVFEELSGDVEFDYTQLPTTVNDSETYTAKGNVNIPINEHSAMRLNAIYNTRDMITDISLDNNPAKPNQSVDDEFEQKYIKLKYLNEISDKLSLYFIGDYSKQEGIAGIYDRGFRAVADNSPLKDIFAADGIVPDEDNLTAVVDKGIFRDQDSGGLQATVSYLFDNDAELINIAAWRYYERDQELDTDYTTQDGFDNGNEQRFEQFSNELRLVLPTIGDVSGQMGLYYFNSVMDHKGWGVGAAGVPGFPICFGPGQCTYQNYDLTLLGSDTEYEMGTTSVALFGQLDYKLSDQWSLIAGGRLTHDELEMDLISGRNADRYISNLGGTPGHYEEDNSVTNFSWKLGTQYFPQDGIMLYASASTGYKAPGYNDGPTPTGEMAVDEETVLAYEIGVKSSWFDNRLQVNASVFHQNFKDYQVQSVDTASQNFLIQNAAEVTSQGAEISVMALLAEGLTLSSAISLLDSTYDDFPGAQCYPEQTTPGCDGSIGARRFNAAGMDLPLAPDVTATTQLRYEFYLNNGMEAYVEGSWYYRSDIYYGIVNDPGTQLGDINIFGLTAGLRSPEGWKLSLFCKNCTDEMNPATINSETGDAQSSIGTYIQSYNYNSVRTIGVNVGYEF